MNRHVPASGVVVLGVISLVSVLAFFLFNQAFGGPGSQVGQTGYELTVKMNETGQLLQKSLVMVNGVKVGEVTKVETDQDGTKVTFTVNEDYRPVRRGGTATLGSRTAFGEAYLRLSRGPQGAPALESGTTIEASEAVSPDEALEALGPDSREHLRSTLQTVDRGINGGDDPDRLRTTVTRVAESVQQLRRLTRAVDDQEDEIAGLVTNGSTVAQALGEREATLRAIVGDGRTTMGTLAARTAALEDGITETRRLTEAANVTLRDLPGLVDDTRPVVDDLSVATKALTPVFDRLGPTVRSTAGVIDGLPQLADTATPALREATPAIEGLEPLAGWLVPTLRNIIPLAEWLKPRANGYAAVFAHLASATASGDTDGQWLRLYLMIDPRISFGREALCVTPRPGGGGTCTNPYPQPNDALNNQPGKPGDFPRLMAAPAP